MSQQLRIRSEYWYCCCSREALRQIMSALRIMRKVIGWRCCDRKRGIVNFRQCAAPHLMTQFRPPAPALRLSAPAVPPSSRPRSRRRSEVPQVRGRSERLRIPRRDPRLPPFDTRQPVSWLAFFRRLARIFRSLTLPVLPVHDYNGDLVGD